MTPTSTMPSCRLPLLYLATNRQFLHAEPINTTLTEYQAKENITMEEKIGILWHRVVGRLTDKSFSDAKVELSSLSHSLAIFFRAMGGDHAIKVQAGGKVKHGARRALGQILSGGQLKTEMAWVDEESLRLPALLNIYPDERLNHNLYLWLTALCAYNAQKDTHWFIRNQTSTLELIERFPGLSPLYFELVEAEIVRRPRLSLLDRQDAKQERMIRDALRRPGSVLVLPSLQRPPAPIPLWTRPGIAATHRPRPPVSGQEAVARNQGEQQTDTRRRSAENAELPSEGNPMLLFRPETILSLTEYAKTDHQTSEDDSDSLCQIADDLDTISIAHDDKNISKRLRMDLDIAHADSDATPLDSGKLLPEWNYKIGALVPDQCRTIMMPVQIKENACCTIPKHLQPVLRKLKNSFSMFYPHRMRLRSQPNGDKIDVDEYIKFHTDEHTLEPYVYIDTRKRERDISSLLLADISLSTDAWAGRNKRVIDVIRESMLIFSSSLSESKDPFSLYGFNSTHRTNVCLYTIKSFDEQFTDTIMRRIDSLEPAAYTRMGAAIRHASEILTHRPSRDRLLLLLTDGKPNDIDYYEGRYGVEDTRMSLIEARKNGIHVFCVTIDQEAHEYMPYIFGKNNFTVIRNLADLPARLTLLYHQITQR